MTTIGVFTTLKVIQGVPQFFDRHKTRLMSHAEQMNITTPPLSLQDIKAYLKMHNLSNCALRITIINKSGIPKLSIEDREFPNQTHGIHVITVEDKRDKLKTLKTTNRTTNLQAKELAEKRGADDALFVQNGMLIESTYANIFSIDSLGNLITPPLDKKGLQGIARQVIMERTQVIEKDIPQDITCQLVAINSLRVEAIITIDGRILPDASELVQKLKTILEEL
jgi:branched-chain amino acid aminotransferase